MIIRRVRIGLLVVGILALVVQVGFAKEIIIDQPLVSNETEDSIYKIEWHPSGDVLAAATLDGVQIFDDALQPVTQIHEGQAIYGISWSPDGSQLAVTRDDDIEIWDWDMELRSLSLLTTLKGEQQQLTVAWSPGGTRIASLEMYHPFSYDGTIWAGTVHIWNTSPFESERMLNGLYSVDFDTGTPVSNRIAWSPNDESTLIADWVSISDDPNPIVTGPSGIYVFDVESGDLTRTIDTSYSTAVTWDPSGTFWAYGTDSGVGIREAATEKGVIGFGGPSVFAVLNVDWSPDGRYLAGDSDVYDFNSKDRLGLGSFLRTTSIVAIDWHPNNVWLATADYNGVLHVEDASLLPGFVLPTVTPTATTPIP